VASQNFPIAQVFLTSEEFPWNWVPALEIKNANDGAIGPKRSLTVTSTYVTNTQTDTGQQQEEEEDIKENNQITPL